MGECGVGDGWKGIFEHIFFERLLLGIRNGEGVGREVEKEGGASCGVILGVFQFEHSAEIRLVSSRDQDNEAHVLHHGYLASQMRNSDLQLAVEKGSQPLVKAGAELVDFTSHANIKNQPGHYVVYWEIKGEASEEILVHCCKEIDAAFVDHGYIVSRKNNSIGPLELCIVEQGTFKKIMEHYVRNGATMSQFKTPRCTTNHILLDILDQCTIRSIRGSAYE
ncbi:indole-3-acetic acid-amido synthetase GH3.10 [Tanacetum coccineum]